MCKAQDDFLELDVIVSSNLCLFLGFPAQMLSAEKQRPHQLKRTTVGVFHDDVLIGIFSLRILFFPTSTNS